MPTAGPTGASNSKDYLVALITTDEVMIAAPIIGGVLFFCILGYLIFCTGCCLCCIGKRRVYDEEKDTEKHKDEQKDAEKGGACLHCCCCCLCCAGKRRKDDEDEELERKRKELEEMNKLQKKMNQIPSGGAGSKGGSEMEMGFSQSWTSAGKNNNNVRSKRSGQVKVYEQAMEVEAF